jgi:hypothetical protein
MQSGPAWAYCGPVNLRNSIDELDVLIAELTDLRQQLCRAEMAGDPESALWDAEVGLHHLARRAEARAQILGRAIELVGHQKSA